MILKTSLRTLPPTFRQNNSDRLIPTLTVGICPLMLCDKFAL